MKRLTRSNLESSVDYLALLTKRDYVVGYWTGLVHVYNKSTGQVLITGTLRQFKDGVDMVILGYNLAIKDIIRQREDKNYDKL